MQKHPKDQVIKPVVIVVLMLFLIVLTVGFVRDFYRKQRVEKQLTALQTEITSLERSNKELKEFFTYLESESFIEAEAKTKMNLKKPGEHVVAVQLSPPGTTMHIPSEAVGTRTESLRQGYAQLWWEHFF